MILRKISGYDWAEVGDMDLIKRTPYVSCVDLFKHGFLIVDIEDSLC